MSLKLNYKLVNLIICLLDQNTNRDSINRKLDGIWNAKLEFVSTYLWIKTQELLEIEPQTMIYTSKVFFFTLHFAHYVFYLSYKSKQKKNLQNFVIKLDWIEFKLIYFFF